MLNSELGFEVDSSVSSIFSRFIQDDSKDRNLVAGRQFSIHNSEFSKTPAYVH